MNKVILINFQSTIFKLKNIWKDWYEYEKGWYLKIDSIIWGKNSNSRKNPFPNVININEQKIAIHIIEIELIDNVIDDLVSLTRNICYVVIDLQPAIKKLDDGRNAHILLAPIDWWVSRFSRRFDCMVTFPINHSSGQAQKVVIACTKDANLLPHVYSFLNKINSYQLVLDGGYLHA